MNSGNEVKLYGTNRRTFLTSLAGAVVTPAVIAKTALAQAKEAQKPKAALAQEAKEAKESKVVIFDKETFYLPIEGSLIRHDIVTVQRGCGEINRKREYPTDFAHVF